MKNTESQGNSKPVTTNQQGLHDRLEEIVLRHLNHPFRKPFADHTLKAFAEAEAWLSQRTGPLILDSCCGVGESSRALAVKHPDASVIGVDRSFHRLQKHEHCFETPASNLLFVRADLIDFWRLAVAAGWTLNKHYILYPNPYPKASQVQRRWHASPVFRTIIELGGTLTVRSNWQLYIDEFAKALSLAGLEASSELYRSDEPMTAFEIKYWASDQETWQCVVSLNSPDR